MRYPTSVIYLIAWYAHHVCGLKTFTSLDLDFLVDPAHAWYKSRIPQEVLDEREAIIKRHGFTHDQWAEVLANSRSFYFCPDNETRACNDELAKLFRPVLFINSPPGHMNGYVRQLVNQARKRKTPVLEYVTRDKPPFTYRINPLYADNPNMPKED
jgi:hypothetical protein